MHIYKLIKKLITIISISLLLPNYVLAQVQSMSYTLAGQHRDFYFIPPDGPTKGLVILLHGLGGKPDNYLETDKYQIITKFKQQGYAFAILKGSNTAPKELSLNTTYLGWNAGDAIDCCSSLYTRYLNYTLRQKDINSKLYTTPNPVNDLGAIQDLSVQGSKALGISQSKVILLGISNGGIMAYRAQCNLPRGTFGAVVSIAGALTGGGICGNGAAPVFLHIHGDKDTVVPYLGGETTVAPLYPAYLFPRGTMASFNALATASSCKFGVSGTNAQFLTGKANPAGVGKIPFATETDWSRYIAKCNSDINMNLLLYKGVGHEGRPSMFDIGLTFASAALN